MHPFSLTFLAVVVASTGLQLWLLGRHAASVRAHRGQVPPAFAASITLDAHRRAADYTLARISVARVDRVAGAVLALAWTLGGGIDWLASTLAAFDLGHLTTGLLLVALTLLLTTLASLPFSLWRTFGVERRFGFNRTTPALYTADLARQLALATVLGIPLLAALLTLMQDAGNLWWLWAWLLWMGFSLLLTLAWPSLIAPLFNRFTPLEQGPLRERVEALLGRHGFASRGIYTMDGSRRSGHGNAYFTGFGRTKRIVLFDTLIEQLEPAELEAVLAHEIGHFRLKHVPKQLLLGALMALAGFALLGWLTQTEWFYQGLGVSTPSVAAALLLFMLTLPYFTVPLQPLTARLSRHHEFEADAFAAGETDAETLVSALVGLYRDNAATLTPDPLYSAFHDSHPPAPLRIAALRARPAH